MSESESQQESNGSPALLRVLGLGIATSMVVGNVIGAGIFLKPSEVARACGSLPLILAVWAVGGFVCFLGALCFAELAVMLPKAGGLYVYLRAAWGRPVAFLFGWSEFVFGRPASIGALAAGIVFQLGILCDRNFGPIEEVGLSLTVIAVLTFVNIRGVLWGGTTQAGTTLLKAGFLAIIAALPWILMSSGHPGVSTENFSSRIDANTSSVIQSFAVALLAVMWAYNGWHAITPVAEEIRDPQKNIPLGLFGGLTLLVVLYMSVNVAYHGVLSMEEVASAGFELPQIMLRRLLQPFGETAINACVMALTLLTICSMFGAINANMMNGPRVTFAMSRDGAFFPQLAQIHSRFRTPVVAILVQAFMSVVLVVAVAILVQVTDRFKDTSVFDVLTNYVVFIATIFYALAVAAVLILRKKLPDQDRPYKTPMYPAIPIVYLVLNVVFLVALYMDPVRRFEANIGFVLTLIGLPVFYGLFSRNAKSSDPSLDPPS